MFNVLEVFKLLLTESLKFVKKEEHDNQKTASSFLNNCVGESIYFCELKYSKCVLEILYQKN